MHRCALTLALSMPAATAAAAPPPTTAALAARLDRAGATATVRELNDEDRFDAVLDRIGQGSADWIALAPRLAPGTDAAAAEGLGIALAHALPLNPVAVLRATGVDDDGAVGIKRVCSIPFIETSPSYNGAYARRALAALSAVRETALLSKRDECRRLLQAP